MELAQARQSIQYRIAMDHKLDKILGREGQYAAEDVTLHTFGRFRSLTPELKALLTQGSFIYEINGQTGRLTLSLDANGKTIVSQIMPHQGTDAKAMRALVEKLMQEGYDFSATTKIGAQSLDLQRPAYFLAKNDVKKPFKPVERKKAGRVLTHKQDLPHQNFSDGQYVYLTYFNIKNGEYSTVTSPIYELNASSGRYYVGHRALHRKFGGPDLVVVSAGEFIIRQGQFARLSNRSGNFMGGTANLNFAKRTFEDKGFNLGKTTFADLEQMKRLSPDSEKVTERGVHNDAFAKATNQHAFVTEAKYEQVRIEAQLMFYRLYKHFPHPDKAGAINRTDVLAHLQANFGNSIEERELVVYIVQLIDVVQNEGMAIAIRNSEGPYLPIRKITSFFSQVTNTLPIKN